MPMMERSQSVIQMDNVTLVLKIMCASCLNLLLDEHITSLNDYPPPPLFTLLKHSQLLAIVDFHPSGLPEGWVKELVFRKTKEGLIRKDPVINNMVHELSSLNKKVIV
jgi:hypothetical protein